MTSQQIVQQTSLPDELKLIFALDRHSTLPKLKVSEGPVIPRERLQAWEQELNGHYERMCHGGLRQIEFSTPLPGLPRRYDVKVRNSGSNGMPTLILTPSGQFPKNGDEGDQSATVTPFETIKQPVPRVADYAAEFVAAVQELFAGIPLPPAERSGIDAVLGELQQIARDRPDRLLLILLAGYLQLRHAHTSTGHRQLDYANASYAVDELCAVLLDELDEPLHAPTRTLFNDHAPRLVKRMLDRLRAATE